MDRPKSGEERSRLGFQCHPAHYLLAAHLIEWNTGNELERPHGVREGVRSESHRRVWSCEQRQCLTAFIKLSIKFNTEVRSKSDAHVHDG